MHPTYFLVMLLAVATLAQAQNDLRLGTWALNVAKSKYTPGPAPASETRTYKTQGAALQVSIESIDTRGNRASLRYTAGDDGRDSPMTGLAFANAVNMKRLDSNTFQIDTKKDGKVIGTTKGEISKDGKTLTLTSKMTNPTGGAITNIAVYDKR